MSFFDERLFGNRAFGTRLLTIATSGVLTDVDAAEISFINFSSCTNLNTLINAFSGQELCVINTNTVPLTIVNNSSTGTVSGKIITGTGANVFLLPGSMAFLKYENISNVWRLLAGGGSSGFQNQNTLGSPFQTIASGGTITIAASGMQQIRVQGDTADSEIATSVTPFGTVAPADGTTVLLIGESNSQTLAIQTSDIAKGVILNGVCVLGKYSTLLVEYNDLLDRYLEISRKP
jgi:hypothetical protein